LNLKHNRVVVHDVSNHVMRRLFGVVMTGRLSAFVESRFEKIGSQLPLASLANIIRYLSPHFGDENNVFQARLPTEVAEYPEVPPSNPAKTVIGYAMDVDDACKLRSFLVSGIQGSNSGWIWILQLHLRCGQEACNHLQDIRVPLRGVIKSRRIGEHHLSSIERELIRKLNFGCA
jgi:hypothetical protein